MIYKRQTHCSPRSPKLGAFLVYSLMLCRQQWRDAGCRQGRAEESLPIAIDSATAACLMLCLKWGSWLLANKNILLLNAVIERDPDMYHR